MLTLNEKADGSGWYILAWASDVGNITYQVEASIAELIIDEGLRDGEEISWTTVRALKTVGALSTKKSGVLVLCDRTVPPRTDGVENRVSNATRIGW